MTNFTLKDGAEYYLQLSENPKKFDTDGPATSVFFDDTNGQVLTVHSGGVTGVAVSGMEESKSTTFRMEDKGIIVCIKFSPDHKVLAIQRNRNNQSATVEFLNFNNLAPTNVEYMHTCKWKTAKILGFVWPKVNEIAFVTDHGIELLQVIPEKKQLKSVKNSSFSAAWFSWCPQSKIVLLAGNNGILLQPFSLNNYTITKLQKLELDTSRPVIERDVFVLRLYEVTWCAIFRHGTSASTHGPGPTEVCLMPVWGGCGAPVTHVLKTGLVGRFAVSVLDDLVVVHHQSSQTSLLFDIMEESKMESHMVYHIPVVPGISMKPAKLNDQLCPMYSDNWVVFQPNYMIDARLGCLWQVEFVPTGLLRAVPKELIPKLVAVLQRRSDAKDTIYEVLNQMISDAGRYLMEIGQVFDEINTVYRRAVECEVSNRTADVSSPGRPPRVVLDQADVSSRVFVNHHDHRYFVQVITLYLSSLCSHGIVPQHDVAELTVRALVTRGLSNRLRAMLRRGCLPDSRPLACQLLSLGHLDPAAAQLALDMMWRLKAYEDILEVLLSSGECVSAVGVVRDVGGPVWNRLPARKVLSAAVSKEDPRALITLYHVLQNRNELLRGSREFTKNQQCETFTEFYNKAIAD